MALKLRFYKCNICGNIVQVFVDGAGELVCCGQEMELLESKTVNIGLEKHVPYFENQENGLQIIRIGTEPHPMNEEHHIQFIEAISNDNKRLYFEFLEPEQVPLIVNLANFSKAYEYCNIHGLWEGNND